MSGFDNFKLRMSISGNSLRQEKINNSKQFLKSTFADDPSYQKDGVQVVGNNTKIYPRLSKRKISSSSSPQMTMQTLIDENFNRGDLFIINNQYWLCSDSYTHHDIYNQGIIKQCNYLCNFQNDSPTILKYWGILEKPILKLDDGKIISSPSDKITLFLPYNEDTKKLYIDKRLFIETGYDNGKEVPVIYQIKSLIHKPNFDKLLEISLERTTYNADSKIDSMEHQIADYIPEEKPPTPPSPDLLICEILGSDRLKVVNREFNYSPVFYLSDGKTIDDSVIPVWTVELLPEQVGKVTWQQNERFIDIKCTDDTMIGTSFKIKLIDDKELYNPIEKTVLVVSMFG